MADTKTTALTENTTPILTDIMPMVDDPGGTPATQKVTLTNLMGLLSAGMLPGGRLTLTTGVPVTTADVAGGTMLYYTPFLHDNIRLFDGTSWRTVAFTEKSLNLAAYTASKPYDIFGYPSTGTLALESLVWTNATTRATTLTRQNGRLTKTGDATRLYLGTIYVNSSGGQTDDSVLKRNVWNYYNRVSKKLKVIDSTDNWTYASAAWQQANASAANQFEITHGVAEDIVDITVSVRIAIGNLAGSVGIGIDATNTNSADTFTDESFGSATGMSVHAAAQYIGTLAEGRHYLAWLEYARSGTVVFYGDAGIPASSQSGMIGITKC